MYKKSFKNQPLTSPEIIFWVVMGGLGIVAVILMRYLTPFGMGLINDSIAYIGGARSLLLGHGYSQLKGNWTYEAITHFPPFLSLALAFIGLFGLEVLRAVRLVNILLFGANVVLTGVITRKMTSSRVFGIAGSVLFIVSAPLLTVHSFALSEPLFLFLSYLALFSLFTYIQSNQSTQSMQPRWVWLVAAGIFTSLGYLTRYVGISLYVTTLIAIVIFNLSWSRRIKDTLIFLAASIPLTAAWSVRNLLVTGNAANRPFFWHPIPADKWYEGLRNFWGWFLPESVNLSDRLLFLGGIALAVILTLIALGVGIYAVRYWRGIVNSKKPAVFTIIFALQGLIYLVMLIVAMSFFDDKTIFEHRMLAPFYVSTLVLIVAGLSWSWHRPPIIGKLISVFLLLALLVSFSKDSLNTAKILHQSGQGYASGRWRNSETMEAVNQLPPLKIFSNKITALYILADRPGYVIPWRFTPPGEPDPSYEQGVKEYQKQVMNGEAVVVIFDYNEEISSGNERVIDIVKGLPVLGMYDDGAMFGLP